MQQTKTYKLNLIEKTDTFSPDPLNENAQKLDTALGTKFAALDAGSDALDTRITALEAHKIVVGSYTGNGHQQTIQLGFCPKVVIIQRPTVSGDCFLATSLGGCATLTNTGFTLDTSGNPNYNAASYAYVAIK
ncbi:MAG: hypothetical protein HDT33_00555 [Clostridiales bacterium]|nr:hypothetical protein [Clostridiales bacterium]